MADFACPSCGLKFRIQPGIAGKQGRCSRCKAVFRIPSSPAPDEAPRSEETQEESPSQQQATQVLLPKSRALPETASAKKNRKSIIFAVTGLAGCIVLGASLHLAWGAPKQKDQTSATQPPVTLPVLSNGLYDPAGIALKVGRSKKITIPDWLKVLRISPDGKRFGCAYELNGRIKSLVMDVRDDLEIPRPAGATALVDGNMGHVRTKDGYEFFDTQSKFGCFSQDSRRFAFIVYNLDDSPERRNSPGPYDGNEYLIVDGVHGKHYKGIGSVTFSPDGNRLAYAIGEAGGDSAMIVDGKPTEPQWLGCSEALDTEKLQVCAERPSLLCFSPDSKHLAYVASMQGEYHIFVDGVASQEAYAMATSPVWSPDSKQWACVVRKKSRGDMQVLQAGKTHKPHPCIFIDTLRFSPDSKHLAYVVTKSADGGPMSVVKDGVQGPEHCAVSPDSMKWTSDGKLTYVFGVKNAKPSSKKSKPGELEDPGDAQMENGLGFQELGMLEMLGSYKTTGFNQMVAMVDGKEITDDNQVSDFLMPFMPGKPELMIAMHRGVQRMGAPDITPDGAHAAYILGDPRKEKAILILDGIHLPYPLKDAVMKVSFDSPDTLTVLEWISPKDGYRSTEIKLVPKK